MNAIIRQETDDGLSMQMIHNVCIVKYYRKYSAINEKWSEVIELCTNSMRAEKVITLDKSTQIILQGGD